MVKIFDRQRWGVGQARVLPPAALRSADYHERG
jgi:hypothetical protein